MTDLIIQQQKVCDKLYLEAIELNFSHEQMTPLNGIIANSKICYKRFVELSNDHRNLMKKIGEMGV